MKRFFSVLIVTIALIFGITACKSEKVVSQTETNKSADKPAEITPVKVLIQTSDTSNCAADGYLFLANLQLTEVKWRAEQPDLAKGLSLESTNGITVVEEYIENKGDQKKEKGKETSETPKSNPKDFDFLIKREVDYKEHTKKSMNAPLKITVKEVWTVEKVSDPSIKTIQTVTYILDGGSNMNEMEKIAEEQLKTVTNPSLAPLLKEVRAFIESNNRK